MRCAWLIPVVCACLLVPLTPPVTAEDPQFEVSWSMFFPRSTYFIGETITFQVMAYAEGMPELALPGQYANIVARNESLFEVFNYWIFTDENGSATVDWVTELDYANGTYLIILTDGFGALLTTQITMLWDDNTAWQRQIADLQQQTDYLWGYLDELYAAKNYLLRRNHALTQAIYFLSFGFALTFSAAIWVWAREYIRVSARTERSKRSGLSSLLGFRTVPFYMQTIDQPSAGNYVMPERHRPPRFGEDYHCPLCDSEAKVKMTKRQWEEHMQDFHDRKRLGLKAFLKARHFKHTIKALYDKGEKDIVFESLLPENVRMDKIAKRTAELKDRMKAGELTKDQARAELDEYRVQLGFPPRWPVPEPVLKETTSAMPESARKPQEEKRISRPTEKAARKRTLKEY